MEILRTIEGIRTPAWDSIMGVVTMLGEELVLIAVLCLVYWCINKRNAYVIAIVYFFSAFTVQGMKVFFRIDRPWITDPTLTPVPLALEGATGYSMPSGHTQSAAALFGTIAYQGKWLPSKLFFYLLMLVVGFSRMYLGVHTMLDVMAALIITMIIVLLADALYTGEVINKARELIMPLAILIFSFAFVVIMNMLIATEYVLPEYAADAFKVAGVAIGFAIGMYIERVFIDFSTKTKNITMQGIKLILGLAGVIAIKEGVKYLIGSGPALDVLRYSLISLWITVIYPFIIKKLFNIKVTVIKNEPVAEAKPE